jgi:hypothetical protein
MATAGRGPHDEAIELIYFAWRELVGEPNRLLARRGLGRVHNRILYCIAPGPGISIGGLCLMLGVSKQALHHTVPVSVSGIAARRHPDPLLQGKGCDCVGGTNRRSRIPLRSLSHEQIAAQIAAHLRGARFQVRRTS